MVKTILVTGATGKQGGSVIKALQDSDFEILAVTRNTTSPSAQKLAQQSTRLANIKLVQGDLDNVPAIFQEAKRITTNPIWGVYSVQVKAAGPDKTIEEKQGNALIDASIAANVKFFVYSSVDRGGVKSYVTPTPVPHWATKHNIEKHLVEKAAGTPMRFAVLRPTAFMEGFTNDFMGKAMASMWETSIPKDKPLQLVATRDIGWFAAQAFNNPDEYAGRYLSLAGAELTFREANQIFKQKFGKDMPSTYGIVSHILLHVAKDVAVMFKWLKNEGTGADVAELKRLHPGLMDFGTWLETESPFRSA